MTLSSSTKQAIILIDKGKGRRINTNSFFSVLLISTIMDRSTGVSAEQAYHSNKSRKFMNIVLVLTGIIILLASIFLIIIIYRTVKSGMLLS